MGRRSPPSPPAPWSVYHVIATDNTGQVSVDPAARPYYYSYKVGQAATTVQFNEVMANATTFIPTADYPTKNLGLLTTSNVGTDTASGVADGYTLVPAMSGSNIYLVDTQGQRDQRVGQQLQLHRALGVLTPDGDLIRSSSLSGSPGPDRPEASAESSRSSIGTAIGSGYFTYAGYDTEAGVSGLGYAQHHNILVMPNGNILMITTQAYTAARRWRRGSIPANLIGGTDLSDGRGGRSEARLGPRHVHDRLAMELLEPPRPELQSQRPDLLHQQRRPDRLRQRLRA